MTTDKYDSASMAAMYDDMDAAKLNAMPADERAAYYHAMYQYFARMLFIVHEVGPVATENDTSPYSNIPQAEYWALSSFGHAYHALVDLLPGLVALAESEGKES